MSKEKIRTAVVGCGAISWIYLHNMITCFNNLEITACCARSMESARKRAEEFHIRACTYEEILADQSIELVVILTPVPAHYDLILKALEAGKHVYTEKTLTDNVRTAGELVELAGRKGLYLGAAPDTFLGSALQTARKAIDEGMIGEVTGFTANANRDLDILAGIHKFLRMPAGGICYDYGVYYLTALVSLLGPVARTAAFVKNRKEIRVNRAPGHPEYGQEYVYPNESQVSAVLEMESGVTGNLMLNGDSVQGDRAFFYIYGTKGILKLGNPDLFGGRVEFIPGEEGEPEELIPWSYYSGNSRGVGVSELADAIREGRENRASGRMAFHVLDIIEQMMESSRTGRVCRVNSTCSRPEGFRDGEKLLTDAGKAELS